MQAPSAQAQVFLEFTHGVRSLDGTEVMLAEYSVDTKTEPFLFDFFAARPGQETPSCCFFIGSWVFLLSLGAHCQFAHQMVSLFSRLARISGGSSWDGAECLDGHCAAICRRC